MRWLSGKCGGKSWFRRNISNPQRQHVSLVIA
ncbi:hypothetical protein CKO_01356 [Citrobacter koseri ATCC BAA-895]|uniref:Uncharacterized protein n=1 Tax=Citrobacter koseri (strain ATCC BAA-895 / CDC 4225-83 / SGSC4696) TaxID=290338 RepID=A8AG80_CITK8|nr:hypothetical protein CKO_01356 [Citrobacter koseri ATCC BAA-895]